eukprot:m.536680 g.536680  ORF g.536680 m.536680 type:complete len:89 (+) comp22072_c0_seq16:779-1045(+)
MTESVAICMYLANKYAPTALAIQPDEPDYSSYLNWLAHADATLTFPQTVVLRYSQQELHKADAAVEGCVGISHAMFFSLYFCIIDMIY